MRPLPVIFEMETSDPDDFMTLLWLCSHPLVQLLGVVVTPGSKDQCQLVRYGLDLCGRKDIPLGALHGTGYWDTKDGQKARVSGFHYKVYGPGVAHHDPGSVEGGPALLASLIGKTPEATILCGAPPKNTGHLLRDFPNITLQRWVQQGGFAGDNLVAEPLAKFAGRRTCASFNPGGAPKETLALLSSPQVLERRFVSKNVCHGVVWTGPLQVRLKERLAGNRDVGPGMTWLVHALDRYLADKGEGKAMHDLVAAACVIDPSVCDFVEVEIYRERGEWGARAAGLTRTWISVGFHEDRFVEVLSGGGSGSPP